MGLQRVQPLSRSSRPSSSVADAVATDVLRLLQTLWLIRQRQRNLPLVKFSFNGTEDFFINQTGWFRTGVCAVATAVAPSVWPVTEPIQVVPQPMFSRLRKLLVQMLGSWCSDANQTTHSANCRQKRVSSAWFAYAIRSCWVFQNLLRYRLCRLYA